VARFKELFGFGKDLFLIFLGEQLISASQTILISRGLGLEMVAIWSVGTKAFYMVALVTRRILDLSIPPLTEMFVRKEHDQLRDRFKAVTIVSASVSSLAAVLIVACNTPFVTIWTHGKITWTAGKDVLLGVWLIVLCVRHCHANLVAVTKDIRFMRFIFLIEGGVFIVLASLVQRWWGLAGIIGCSIACNTCISGAYALRRSRECFGISMGEVSWNWLKPTGKELLALVLLTFAVYVPTEPLAEWARLLIRGPLLGSLGICVLLRYGLPIELKRELAHRLPQSVGFWARRVANVPRT
jgi:O-antigen/teichoic acid export membrane protein